MGVQRLTEAQSAIFSLSRGAAQEKQRWWLVAGVFELSELAEERFRSLYEQYGKPLEQEHWGEFLAVSADGRVLLGRDHLEVAQQALAEFGPGGFLYKVGEIAVGRWRAVKA